MAQAFYLVMAVDETDLEMGMSEQELACAIFHLIDQMASDEADGDRGEDQGNR